MKSLDCTHKEPSTDYFSDQSEWHTVSNKSAKSAKLTWLEINNTATSKQNIDWKSHNLFAYLKSTDQSSIDSESDLDDNFKGPNSQLGFLSESEDCDSLNITMEAVDVEGAKAQPDSYIKASKHEQIVELLQQSASTQQPNQYPEQSTGDVPMVMDLRTVIKMYSK